MRGGREEEEDDDDDDDDDDKEEKEREEEEEDRGGGASWVSRAPEKSSDRARFRYSTRDRWLCTGRPDTPPSQPLLDTDTPLGTSW
jgi:hypothetical protein